MFFFLSVNTFATATTVSDDKELPFLISLEEGDLKQEDRGEIQEIPYSPKASASNTINKKTNCKDKAVVACLCFSVSSILAGAGIYLVFDIYPWLFNQ